MKNFVKDGNILDLTAPYAVVAGGGMLVGNAFGVSLNTVASGGAAEVKVTGVFDITKNTPDVISAGGFVYWDDTNKRVTSTSASNTKIGVCETTVSSGGLVARTRLNGAF